MVPFGKTSLMMFRIISAFTALALSAPYAMAGVELYHCSMSGEVRSHLCCCCEHAEDETNELAIGAEPCCEELKSAVTSTPNCTLESRFPDICSAHIIPRRLVNQSPVRICNQSKLESARGPPMSGLERRIAISSFLI